MIKTVLFDFDGTLFDTSEGIIKCVRYALESFGIDEKDEESLKTFIGPVLSNEFERKYNIDGAAAMAKFREKYAVTGVYESKVYDGIPELIKALSDRGVRLAVASLKPVKFIRLLLEKNGLLDYFEIIAGDKMDGTKIDKTSVVRSVLEELGSVDIQTTAMVGDRYEDVIAGRRNGLITVGSRYGFTQDAEFERGCVECQVRSVAELSDFLLYGKRPVVLAPRNS